MTNRKIAKFLLFLLYFNIVNPNNNFYVKNIEEK